MRIYNIAGLRVKIENQYPFTDKFCAEYLSEDQVSPVDITAKVTEEEFAEEKKNSSNFSDGYIENICLYRSICSQIPQLKRLLLHAAVLEYNGNGYAFLGRSGTGKSTHTGLWMKHIPNIRIVNGDKPILEYKEDCFIVYGTPWMGKERLGNNIQAPLKGLCFLEQAKENAIRKLTPSEASMRLFTQVLIPQEEGAAVATLELLDDMLRTTPAYVLQCNISEEAVKTSFETLTGDVYDQIKRSEEKENED